MSQPQSPTRCVLLVPKGGRASARGRRLKELLDRRGWQAHEANETLAALAELCLLDRARSSRRSWGLPDAGDLAMVVVQPPSWPQVEELLAAARRYVPRAALWSYDGGALHPLSPPPPQAAQPEAAPAATGRPKTNHQAAAPEQPFISRQEIDMLLQRPDQEPSS